MKARRVLVVDDKAGVRKLLATLLGNTYDVVTASDGAMAASMVEAMPVDVVITDVRMPRADGFELLRTLRIRAPSIPVVMMTAYGSIPDAVGAIRLGAFDYVTKPIDADQVRLVVARAVESLTAGGPAVHPTSSERASSANVLDPSDCFDTIEEVRERATRRYLVALMSHCQGNVTHAAIRAGMTRESLHRVLRQHAIGLEQFRKGPAGQGEGDEKDRVARGEGLATR
jgi:DNA-binding NtrC family response regulator